METSILNNSGSRSNSPGRIDSELNAQPSSAERKSKQVVDAAKEKAKDRFEAAKETGLKVSENANKYRKMAGSHINSAFARVSSNLGASTCESPLPAKPKFWFAIAGVSATAWIGMNYFNVGTAAIGHGIAASLTGVVFGVCGISVLAAVGLLAYQLLAKKDGLQQKEAAATSLPEELQDEVRRTGAGRSEAEKPVDDARREKDPALEDFQISISPDPAAVPPLGAQASARDSLGDEASSSVIRDVAINKEDVRSEEEAIAPAN